MPLSASFVCSVLKTKWPVRAARMAISVVSRSRISPIMMTSGSPRRMLRRPRAKVRSISGLTASWTMPGILCSTGSSTVSILREVALISPKKRVERGRLARAGGPGQENDAVRIPQQLVHGPAQVVPEPQGVEGEGLLPEQTETDRLSFYGRNRGHPRVNAPSRHPQVHAAVLGKAPFRDVEPRHDLETRHERGLDGLDIGRGRDFPQLAIHPNAKAKPDLQGLQVNVGRLLFKRLPQDVVHELENGGLLLFLVEQKGRNGRGSGERKEPARAALRSAMERPFPASDWRGPILRVAILKLPKKSGGTHVFSRYIQPES